MTRKAVVDGVVVLRGMKRASGKSPRKLVSTVESWVSMTSTSPNSCQMPIYTECMISKDSTSWLQVLKTIYRRRDSTENILPWQTTSHLGDCVVTPQLSLLNQWHVPLQGYLLTGPKESFYRKPMCMQFQQPHALYHDRPISVLGRAIYELLVKFREIKEHQLRTNLQQLLWER